MHIHFYLYTLIKNLVIVGGDLMYNLAEIQKKKYSSIVYVLI